MIILTFFFTFFSIFGRNLKPYGSPMSSIIFEFGQIEVKSGENRQTEFLPGLEAVNIPDDKLNIFPLFVIIVSQTTTDSNVV